MDATVDGMPTLNEAWFKKRLETIRKAPEHLAAVELRCVIRELHVAFRFRDVKQARRELNKRGGLR